MRRPRPFRERRRELSYRGITTTRRRWLTCVEVTAIDVPRWARDQSIPELAADPRHCWFKGRVGAGMRAALGLIEQDREAGGNPLLVKVEYRQCPICKRLLLHLDADRRRQLDESHFTGRQIACGTDCTQKAWRDKGVE